MSNISLAMDSEGTWQEWLSLLVIPAIREGKEKGFAGEQRFAGFDSRGSMSIASEQNDCITLVVEDDFK